MKTKILFNLRNFTRGIFVANRSGVTKVYRLFFREINILPKIKLFYYYTKDDEDGENWLYLLEFKFITAGITLWINTDI